MTFTTERYRGSDDTLNCRSRLSAKAFRRTENSDTRGLAAQLVRAYFYRSRVGISEWTSTVPLVSLTCEVQTVWRRWCVNFNWCCISSRPDADWRFVLRASGFRCGADDGGVLQNDRLQNTIVSLLCSPNTLGMYYNHY